MCPWQTRQWPQPKVLVLTTASGQADISLPMQHWQLLTRLAAAACKTARKACANCSCGRADAEAKGEKMTLDKLQNFSSACGSVRAAACCCRSSAELQAGTCASWVLTHAFVCSVGSETPSAARRARIEASQLSRWGRRSR